MIFGSSYSKYWYRRHDNGDDSLLSILPKKDSQKTKTTKRRGRFSPRVIAEGKPRKGPQEDPLQVFDARSSPRSLLLTVKPNPVKVWDARASRKYGNEQHVENDGFMVQGNWPSPVLPRQEVFHMETSFDPAFKPDIRDSPLFQDRFTTAHLNKFTSAGAVQDRQKSLLLEPSWESFHALSDPEFQNSFWFQDHLWPMLVSSDQVQRNRQKLLQMEPASNSFPTLPSAEVCDSALYQDHFRTARLNTFGSGEARKSRSFFGTSTIATMVMSHSDSSIEGRKFKSIFNFSTVSTEANALTSGDAKGRTPWECFAFEDNGGNSILQTSSKAVNEDNAGGAGSWMAQVQQPFKSLKMFDTGCAVAS